ncbi:MADS-box transcription factor 55 [Monoraphidium neglectum]|uniref:MADS-box transcription factor 55 n=1 Tax=Monoraphidium neglectum TaxID=145388 RepID=A0A0D2N8G6_9CHLO|nr:MADS-box transcription factor 55 [Monoraphidium neglectum]KIZ02036.1 MADS-box transcription factor 55 [Monoraphidium neglectum]|eukprot:XP_013901055.1 MADS-box transcription factor 55 [Monoraphidium neglectum]
MRHRTELRYIQQGGLRQETYEKRKRSLMRKAMELAVMCNSQVALVMFDDKGRLTQFSTAEMDAVLEQYGKAVLEPHERYTPHDMLYGNVWANGFGLGPMAGGAGGTTQGTAPAQSPGDSPASSSEAFQAAAGAQQLLGPLGLAVDAATFPPLSPRRLRT